MDLDRLGIKTQAISGVDEKVPNVLSLVSLKLDDLAHLSVTHDSAIAGKLLLDHLENLLLVKLLRETLDGSQGLTSISLCKSTCQHLSLTIGASYFASSTATRVARDDAVRRRQNWHARITRARNVR